jgi:hypothetical protein
MSSVKVLLLSIVVGVAGAVIVVAADSVLGDAVGGVLGIAGLIGVTRSAILLAGEGGDSDDASIGSRR